MPVIHNKVSRVAYRKVIKQLNQPLYLQQILIRKDQANISEIQKFIDQHNQYGQEVKEGLESGKVDLTCLAEIIDLGHGRRVQEQVVDTDLELNGQQNRQGNLVEQSLIGIEQKQGSQNTGNKRVDCYFEQFINRNKTRNSYNKVQRQRLNIELQNYKDLQKTSNKKILTLTQSIQTLCTQLDNIYKKCRQQLSKLAYPNQKKCNNDSSICSSTTIEKYKKKEQKIQQYIKKGCIMLTHQLNCRRFLVRSMLKNQYYQDCGLVWLIKDIVELENEEVRIWGELRKLGVGLGLSDASNWGKYLDELTQVDFPDSLDCKSKQYLFDIYLKIKKQKCAQRDQSSQVKSRSSNKLPQSSYILGSPSSIFPHSPPASLKNSLVIYPASTTNGQISPNPSISSHPLAPTPTFLFSRTNDSILRKSNIVDLTKNIEVHALPQKYNYDIKCIYANTKQSLLKWVKGKCKQVKDVNYRYQNQKQKQKEGNCSVDHFKKSKLEKKDIKNSALNEEEMVSSLKLETQTSVLVSGKEQEIVYTRIGSFVNCPMKMKNIQQIKQSGRYTKTRQKQIKQQGSSLPLITNRKKQNFQADYNKLADFVKNKKSYKKNRNQFNSSLKNLSINIINPQKITSHDSKRGEQKDLSILSKQKQRCKQLENKTSVQLSQEKELKQKIRILRVYGREKQEWALKLMFGIQVRRQQLIHHLYW